MKKKGKKRIRSGQQHIHEGGESEVTQSDGHFLGLDGKLHEFTDVDKVWGEYGTTYGQEGVDARFAPLSMKVDTEDGPVWLDYDYWNGQWEEAVQDGQNIPEAADLTGDVQWDVMLEYSHGGFRNIDDIIFI